MCHMQYIIHRTWKNEHGKNFSVNQILLIVNKIWTLPVTKQSTYNTISRKILFDDRNFKTLQSLIKRGSVSSWLGRRADSYHGCNLARQFKCYIQIHPNGNCQQRFMNLIKCNPITEFTIGIITCKMNEAILAFKNCYNARMFIPSNLFKIYCNESNFVWNVPKLNPFAYDVAFNSGCFTWVIVSLPWLEWPPHL